MILEGGNHVLIVHRRLFDQDKTRFFTGKVDAYENGMARVTGYTWIQDSFHGKMQRKEGLRTKIVSLVSGTLIVYLIPAHCDISRLKIEYKNDHRIIVSDGEDFHLDLTEGLSVETSSKQR